MYRDDHTGYTVFKDFEFDVTTIEHPVTYEILAWEVANGEKFPGCVKIECEVPALLMLDYFRGRVLYEVPTDEQKSLAVFF